MNPRPLPVGLMPSDVNLRAHDEFEAFIVDGGARALSLLPDGAVFVNVSGGGPVDVDALMNALTSGKSCAAGLDVSGSEPDFTLRFANLDNVILSPHVGGASLETRNAIGFRALDNIAAVLGGKRSIDKFWS